MCFSYTHGPAYREEEGRGWMFLGGKMSCNQRENYLKSYLSNETNLTMVACVTSTRGTARTLSCPIPMTAQ